MDLKNFKEFMQISNANPQDIQIKTLLSSSPSPIKSPQHTTQKPSFREKILNKVIRPKVQSDTSIQELAKQTLVSTKIPIPQSASVTFQNFPDEANFEILDATDNFSGIYESRSPKNEGLPYSP